MSHETYTTQPIYVCYFDIHGAQYHNTILDHCNNALHIPNTHTHTHTKTHTQTNTLTYTHIHTTHT